MRQPSLSSARAIEARPFDLQLSERTPRYWMGGDPYETHLLNAFSLTFPAGERFFMSSVRALRDRVKDPTLLRQVRGFLAQEALHSREHSVLNLWLERLGYPALQVEQQVADEMATNSAQREPLDDLAVTCALEHFTAIMAEAWLSDRDMRARCHEDLKPLWLWHALEELDHKAVAFDVYTAAGGGHERRVWTMFFVTIGLFVSISSIQRALMERDGESRNAKSWARGVWRYWGPRGHFTKLIPSYLAYYRRDFHPWQRDDSSLIAQAEQELRQLREARPPREC